ncbi:unnamed protein product [Camellia sinensis]
MRERAGEAFKFSEISKHRSNQSSSRRTCSAQKWTPEEEAALRAGVVKHGAGKWRTILKVDKWRNMSVMANGWGSRERARLALKRMRPAPKEDENAMAVCTVVQSDEEIVDAKLLQFLVVLHRLVFQKDQS